MFSPFVIWVSSILHELDYQILSHLLLDLYVSMWVPLMIMEETLEMRDLLTLYFLILLDQLLIVIPVLSTPGSLPHSHLLFHAIREEFFIMNIITC